MNDLLTSCAPSLCTVALMVVCLPLDAMKPTEIAFSSGGLEEVIDW